MNPYNALSRHSGYSFNIEHYFIISLFSMVLVKQNALRLFCLKWWFFTIQALKVEIEINP